MNEYYFSYTKLRQDFGHPCCFETTEPRVLGSIPPQPDLVNNFIRQNPRTLTADNIAELSEHTVNTKRINTCVKGMKHTEGGWPKDVDSGDVQDTNKWKKRVERDPIFLQTVKQLTAETSKIMQQNKYINVYEKYFDDCPYAPVSASIHVKSIAEIKDPLHGCGRNVTCICWQPEYPSKFAVGYASFEYQRRQDSISPKSFIWDMHKPSEPSISLDAPSPVVTKAFNNKIPDLLLGGCQSGLVCLWDFRKGADPVEVSHKDNSHYDPVMDVLWLQSKTNSEFVSTSCDGRVLWWDTRNMKSPVETCNLNHNTKETSLGGICVEWALEAGPTKYLVGTEEGYILGLKTRPKKGVEITHRYGTESGRHHGAVRRVKRNPFHAKYFISVGDWAARIWNEEARAPLLSTPNHETLLTDACWSPTRAGLFTTCRADGFLDFWDLHVGQNKVVHQHKVSSRPLTAAAFQSQGQHIAVGDKDGAVFVLSLCDYLSTPGLNEKAAIGQLLEREMRREKNIEILRKQAESMKKQQDDKQEKKEKTTTFSKSDIEGFCQEFFTKLEGNQSTPAPSQAERYSVMTQDDASLIN